MPSAPAGCLPAPETDNDHKKATVRKRRKLDGLADLQAEARRRASALVRAARRIVADVDLDDDMYDQLEDAAMLTCLGRAAVPRHAYGKREIDGIPIIEEPARVTGQIVSLAKSLLALGVSRARALALAGKCALDTVPQARLSVLRHLADGGAMTVSELRRRTGLHRHVARHALEDMEVLDLTGCLRSQQEEDAEDTGFPATNPWDLGPEKALVVRVFAAQNATEQENPRTPPWHEVLVSQPQPPKKETLTIFKTARQRGATDARPTLRAKQRPRPRRPRRPKTSAAYGTRPSKSPTTGPHTPDRPARLHTVHVHRRRQMIPPTGPAYEARYSHDQPTGRPYFTMKPVVAWDDRGAALVPDEKSGRLVQATSYSNFSGLCPADPPLTAAIPGGGWQAEHQGDDNTTFDVPVVAWTFHSDGSINPVCVDADGITSDPTADSNFVRLHLPETTATPKETD